MKMFFQKNNNSIKYLENEENKDPLLQSFLQERKKRKKNNTHNSTTPIIPNASNLKKLNITITKKENSLNDSNKKMEINEYSYFKDKKDKIHSYIDGSKSNSRKNSIDKGNNNNINIIYNKEKDYKLNKRMRI